MSVSFVDLLDQYWSAQKWEVNLLITCNLLGGLLLGLGGAILLAANQSGTGGSIDLDRLTVTSNGGNITLGGGAADGSGYAKGLSYTSAAYTPQSGMGVDIRGNSSSSSSTTINAGGGNILINGKGAASGTTGQYAIGVNMVMAALRAMQCQPSPPLSQAMLTAGTSSTR